MGPTFLTLLFHPPAEPPPFRHTARTCPQSCPPAVILQEPAHKWLPRRHPAVFFPCRPRRARRLSSPKAAVGDLSL